MDYQKKPVEISDGTFAETIQKYPMVVVDFWAEWCGPCKMIAPELEELAGELSGKVVFCKLNVDENMEIPAKFGISGIPTLLVFRKGKLVDKIIGFSPKENILARLQPHILLSE